MTSEYWLVVGKLGTGGTLYLTPEGRWSSERLCAQRYLQRERAKKDAKGRRLVHVRIRPRTERLYLAGRVKDLENELRGTKAKLNSAEYQLKKARDEIRKAAGL